MDKLEIIEDVAKHYNLGNRSLVGGRCVYYDGKGNCCAVGRYLAPDQMRMVEDSYYNNDSVDELFDYLQTKSLHGHDANFWQDLQNLHDREICWTQQGLSDDGQQYVNLLKNRYKND